MAKDRREKTMSDEVTNIVWIAGTIKTLKVEKDRVFMLVDVGEKSKFIRCTVWDDETLSTICSHFQVEDFIRIVGWACGWSQKKGNDWVNAMDIRITAIRNNPPKRAAKP